MNEKIRNTKFEIRSGRRLGFLFVFYILYFVFIETSHGAFKDTGWGTRAAGMGGAFTAVSDDSNAIAYNPAGLARLESTELSIMYAKPFVGLDLKAGADGETSLGMNHVAFAAPAGGWGSIGVSWANFNVTQLYREDTYALGYAKALHERFLAGVNLKSMSTKFTLDDYTRTSEASTGRSPFRTDTSASAFSLDAGLLMKPIDPLWIGFTARNVNSPDVGLRDEDRIPREHRLGAAWTMRNVAVFEEITSSVEMAHRKPKGNPSDVRALFGVESWFRDRTYAVRLGGNDREMSFGGSYNQDFRRFALRLDYAFVWSTVIQDNSGTHRLSLTLRGGGAGRTAELARRPQPDLNVLTGAALAVAEGDWKKAESLYQKFINAFPDHKMAPDIYESLGQVQLILEKWEAAETTFVRIVSRYPSSLHARNAKAYLVEIQRHFQQVRSAPQP